MTLHEFIALNESEKANAVWGGKFLGTREEKEQTVFLYKVYDFFCEVIYERKENSIVKIRPFKTKGSVTPILYLSIENTNRRTQEALDSNCDLKHTNLF